MTESIPESFVVLESDGTERGPFATYNEAAGQCRWHKGEEVKAKRANGHTCPDGKPFWSTCSACMAKLAEITNPPNADVVIEPAADQNAPEIPWAIPGEPHWALCGCFSCNLETMRHLRIIHVRPWLCTDPATRAKPEPTAKLTYGGVTIDLPLTYVHNLVGLFCMDQQSTYAQSHAIVKRALSEIENRMWKDGKGQ